MKTLEAPKEGFYFDAKKHAYFLDGKPLQGVTSILGVIAKPALIQWAVNEAIKLIKERSITFEEAVKSLPYATAKLIIDEGILEEARYAHRKKKEDAADKGTDLHALIEEYVVKMIRDWGGKALVSNTEDPIYKFTLWAADNGIRFIESEKKLYHKELAIAGTCDLVFEKDGKTYIGDIKTYKKLWDRVPMLQCAAYGLMWEEMHNPVHPDFPNGLNGIKVNATPKGMPTMFMNAGSRIDGYCVIRIKDNDFETKWSYDVEGDREGFLAALRLYRCLNNWN